MSDDDANVVFHNIDQSKIRNSPLHFHFDTTRKDNGPRKDLCIWMCLDVFGCVSCVTAILPDLLLSQSSHRL